MLQQRLEQQQQALEDALALLIETQQGFADSVSSGDEHPAVGGRQQQRQLAQHQRQQLVQQQLTLMAKRRLEQRGDQHGQQNQLQRQQQQRQRIDSIQPGMLLSKAPAQSNPSSLAPKLKLLV